MAKSMVVALNILHPLINCTIFFNKSNDDCINKNSGL